MKTLIDKTYNNAKIKEINSHAHQYLAKHNLKIAVSEIKPLYGEGLNFTVVREGELFLPENILFTHRSSKSFKPDDAYNSILNLFKALMDKFGWDEELSRGNGWKLEQSQSATV